MLLTQNFIDGKIELTDFCSKPHMRAKINGYKRAENFNVHQLNIFNVIYIIMNIIYNDCDYLLVKLLYSVSRSFHFILKVI